MNDTPEANDGYLRSMRTLLDNMFGETVGVGEKADRILNMTEAQRLLSNILTQQLNEDGDGIPEIAREFWNIAKGHYTSDVIGAALQLMLSTVNGLAHDFAGDIPEPTPDVLKQIRLDVCVAVCDIMLSTVASDQGLENNDD